MVNKDTAVQSEYNKIKNDLLTLGVAVYRQLCALQRASERGDDAEYRTIIADDKKIDELEISIDDMCIMFMGQRAPLGHDLRFILGAMDIARGLERIGDCVEYVARHLREQPQLKTACPELWEVMRKMLNDNAAMLKLSYESIKEKNPVIAEEAYKYEDAVDDGQKKAHRMIKEGLDARKYDAASGIAMLLVVNKLESIGDIANHIAETLVYITTAENIRHAASRPVPTSEKS